MAVDVAIDSNYEIKDLKHSLRTAGLELSLERSKHSVEMVAKDEDIRKLRVEKCLLQDENDDLGEQLQEEQKRSDGLERALDDALAQIDERAAAGEAAQNQIRTLSREVANLKAELKAMENLTSDSDKILSEKLALTRELSSLRPEVEHLRAQVETNQGLLAEKLALQRQLNTAQVELENEKRTSARALAKQEKKMEQDENLRAQLEELRSELAKEKKDRLKAEAALAKAEEAAERAQADLEAQQHATERAQAKLDKASKEEARKASEKEEQRDAEIESLRQELAQEKSARAAAEKASAESNERDAQLEELQQQLDQERRQRLKLDKASKKSSQQSSQSDEKIDELKKELDTERRERKQQEKEHNRTVADLEARNTILDDKLKAFREKLRSTKEALKQKEEEIQRAERAQTAPPTKAIREMSVKPAAKNVRKRMAASVEPEPLGDPIDSFVSKKPKRGISSTAIGDTSNFSLTPFLNRTVLAAPGETILEEAEEATPTAKKALAPSASNKANAKPSALKNSSIPPLGAVTEEGSTLSSRDNSENAPVTIPLKAAAPAFPSLTKKPPTSKVKPRKSLLSFATFTDEPAPEKKKKRKIGGASKTLFDDEEGEDAVPSKPSSNKGLIAARALGRGVLGKAGRGPIGGGFGMMSEEGFEFSPLKKDRRGGKAEASFPKK